MTGDSVKPNALERLTAFLIPQANGYRDVEEMDIKGLKTTLSAQDISTIFPGEPVAASSYSLRSIDSDYMGSSAVGMDVSEDDKEWIPSLAATKVGIIDAQTGGQRMANHFAKWLMENDRDANTDLADL